MIGSGSRRPPGHDNDARPTGTDEVPVGADHLEDPNPYLPGEVIGDRYRLVRELGRGGMGVVWVAHAISLEVDVAIKLIRVSDAGQAVATRMAREAHAAARLGHPALVRVFDFGWTNRSDPYLVMELVQGETMSKILGREPFIDAIHAVQMILPIADGLRLAHEHAIIHRDIKPENILIATDALGRIQPKLLDFGIAKIGPTNPDLRLTQVGVALGSPEYMSPEQAQGLEDIDERTDVWSLAVVLYEMTTGTIPFMRDNYNALLQSIIHDPPAPVPEETACDLTLWPLIERGLRKDRSARWGSMAEFGEALAMWLYDQGTKEDISCNSLRAVWLDGAISGVKHAAISVRPEPIFTPIEQFKSAPHRSDIVTEPGKRKLAGRVNLQRHLRLITGLAILAGAALGALLTLALARKGAGNEVRLATTYPPLQLGWGSHLGTKLAKVILRLPEGSRRTTNFAQDARELPLAGSRDSTGAKASAGSKKRSRTSSKNHRDFGF